MAVLQSSILKFSNYCRCLTTARFTTSSFLNKQSLEEKLGLSPRPKKPATPFLRFIANIRPELLQQKPDVKPTEIVKIAADRWKKADDNTKENLKKQYEKDLLKYHEEIKLYDEKLTPGDRDLLTLEKENQKIRKDRKKLKKQREELGCPKKPPTPFLLYLKEKANERGDSSFQEWQSRMSKTWNSLTDDEKKPYSDLHKKELEEFKKKMSKWEQEMINQGMGKVLKHN